MEQKRTIFMGIDVPRGTLNLYEALLQKWNPKINLVAASTLNNIWETHFQDALELAPYLDGEDEIVDLGSGNGIPGMVLAICGFPKVNLIECDLRKVIFLREVKRITKVEVSIRHGLIEDYDGPPADAIISRGFSSVGNILKLGEAFRKESGQYLCLKGKSFEEELSQIDTEKFEYRAYPLSKGVLLQIKKK